MKGFRLETEYLFLEGDGYTEEGGLVEAYPEPGETPAHWGIEYLRDAGITIPASDWFFEGMSYRPYPEFGHTSDRGGWEIQSIMLIARPVGWTTAEIIEIYEAIRGDYQPFSMRDFQEEFDPDGFIQDILEDPYAGR